MPPSLSVIDLSEYADTEPPAFGSLPFDRFVIVRITLFNSFNRNLTHMLNCLGKLGWFQHPVEE